MQHSRLTVGADRLRRFTIPNPDVVDRYVVISGEAGVVAVQSRPQPAVVCTPPNVFISCI